MSEVDITDDPGWQDFTRRVKRELVPKITDSAMSISLVPEGEPDVKFAVELGMSIMLDKPLIMVIQPGARVPNKVILVADEIVEADMRTAAGRKRDFPRVSAAIERVRAKLDAAPDPSTPID